MNFIKNIISYIKSFFNKEKIKMIESSPQTSINEKKKSFIESLKFSTTQKENTKKIETLICEGDGLGIQNKITY